jgi:hypothetical protein
VDRVEIPSQIGSEILELDEHRFHAPKSWTVPIPLTGIQDRWVEEREVVHLGLAQGFPLDEPGANGVTHEVSG